MEEHIPMAIEKIPPYLTCEVAKQKIRAARRVPLQYITLRQQVPGSIRIHRSSQKEGLQNELHRVTAINKSGKCISSNSVTHAVSKGKGGATLALTCSPLDVQVSSAGLGYASCPDANSVSIFNGSTNQVVTTVTGIPSPQKLSLGLNETRLAVANGTAVGPHVTILDTATNAVVDTIDLTPFGASSAFSVSSFRTFLAIGSSSGHVFRYDISTSPATLLEEYAGAANFAAIKHLAFTPDGTKLYVAVNQPISVTGENGVVQFGNGPPQLTGHTCT